MFRYIARHAVSQIILLIPHFFVKFSLLSVGIFSKCPLLPRMSEIKFYSGHVTVQQIQPQAIFAGAHIDKFEGCTSLSSTISVMISRWSQGWMRTDRWAIEAQTGITYIAVALLVTFHKLLFQPQAFSGSEPLWKILSSFIDEVCTKLDFEQLFLSRLDWRLVTEESQL